MDYDYLASIAEELENLLKNDEIYADNDETQEDWKSNQLSSLNDLLKIVATDTVVSLLCIISIILTPVVSTGITQHVYMTKSMILLLSSLPNILPASLILSSEILKGTEEYETDPSLTIITSSSIEQPTTSISYIHSLASFFTTWDEMTTLILAHELFQCVVKIERRDYKLIYFVRMQVASVLIAASTYGLHNLFLLIDDEWWKSLIYLIYPINSLFSFAIFLLILYCGISMLMTLLQSDQFHSNAAAANDRKHRHLVFIIYTIILSQFLKLALRITVMVLLVIIEKNFEHCVSQFEKSQNEFQIVNCLSSSPASHWFPASQWLARPNLSGLLEVIGVICILIHKKRFTKA